MPPVDLTARHDGTSAARVAEGTASSVPYMYMRQDMLTLASDAINRIDIATGGTRERLPRPAMTTRIRGTMAAGTPSAIADWPSEQSLATPPPWTRDDCEAQEHLLEPMGPHSATGLPVPGIFADWDAFVAFHRHAENACPGPALIQLLFKGGHVGAILISTVFTQSVDQPQYELPWN